MRTLPRGLGAITGAASVLVAVAAASRRFVRVEVCGHSMAPELRPGDRVVAVRGLRARSGDVVATVDPREPARLLVKRVVEVRGDGSVVLAGDNAGASTDSRSFGAVAPELVVGRVVWRYQPQDRRGRVNGRRRHVR
ncbi:MAG TPA: nickel-type superoxide dismutase maturation protease [Acidimicrobiales bacterium]|nr:nickel-type superoxide dismutase maturation protease [Acidimicrobiales bacterium]